MIAQRGLRFYGRALREGAKLALDRIPDRTKEAIALVEEAADAVGETLPASTGSLLIVHNWLSMHDRTEQTVTGTKARRQASLCFVKKPHEGLFAPVTSSATGVALVRKALTDLPKGSPRHESSSLIFPNPTSNARAATLLTSAAQSRCSSKKRSFPLLQP